MFIIHSLQRRLRHTTAGLAVLCTMGLVVPACNDSDSGSGAEAETTSTGAASGTTDHDAATSQSNETDEGDSTATEESSLFDSSVIHDIEVSFDEAAYDTMIETFSETGDKEWIEATVTIDGTTYERAGLRLKGNSSLAGLGGRGFGGMPRPEADAGSAPNDTATTDPSSTGDSAPDETASDDASDTTVPDSSVPENAGPVGEVDEFAGASEDEPEALPWLIRLDEYVEGQDHQGYEDIVMRSNNSETSLNEAVALDLLEEAGLASQQAAATSFSVNGSDAVLRLAIEHPDDDAWYERVFADEGALYKAESTGDWSYRGDDPTAYEDVWDQEGGSEVADLTPLTEFLRFINESNDKTFNAQLAEHLDVDAFATYLAAQELLGNFDDIDGPGNNAYLWYDAQSQQFTVVSWDMNLAFGAMGQRGGGDFPGGIDEGEFPGGSVPEGFPDLAGGSVPEGFPDLGGSVPEGFPDLGGSVPEGFPDLADGSVPEGFPRGGEAGEGGGPGSRSNPLVERFHDDAEFEALYEQKLDELRASLFDSGVASDILAGWTSVLENGASDLVDVDTITEEADQISDQFDQE